MKIFLLILVSLTLSHTIHAQPFFERNDTVYSVSLFDIQPEAGIFEMPKQKILIPVRSDIIVELFDADGNLQSIIIDDTLKEGEYTLNFDKIMKDKPSGMYFIKLIAKPIDYKDIYPKVVERIVRVIFVK